MQIRRIIRREKLSKFSNALIIKKKININNKK